MPEVWFLGFCGVAQGEESRFLSQQAILTILIAVQYLNKAEKSITYSRNLYGCLVDVLGLKTLDIMSGLCILVSCYVVFEQNNEDFEIFMYIG